jgi:hypothetical protein
MERSARIIDVRLKTLDRSGTRAEASKPLEEYMNMSMAFIRRNVVAVVIVLLFFVGGWKYLDEAWS